MIKCIQRVSIEPDSMAKWSKRKKQNKEFNSLCVHAVQAYVHLKVVLRKYAMDDYIQA